ncbi:hypothetical protein [Salinarimonas rosea]|uniref:hypothetical protein n=1 Tax=Salinarimonas rosea TaxID=552063 RepID=UPI000427D6B7|nr:hypothetical protein [Salinarimonas rosea]
MRGYVEEKREEREAPTPEYAAFPRRKVDIARASMRSGDLRTSEDVEAEFTERRRRLGVDLA